MYSLWVAHGDASAIYDCFVFFVGNCDVFIFKLHLFVQIILLGIDAIDSVLGIHLMYAC